jgi:hypothetical protein
MKATQPPSDTIRQIEFELEKAEHGMGLPYDAERRQSIIQTTSGILKRSCSLSGWRTLLMKSTHVCLRHMSDSGSAMACLEQRRKPRCFAGLHSTGRRRPPANLSLSSTAK